MEETWATDLLGAIKYPNVTGVSQYFVSVNLFFGKPIETLKKKLKNCLWLRSIVLVEEQTDNPSPKGLKYWADSCVFRSKIMLEIVANLVDF